MATDKAEPPELTVNSVVALCEEVKADKDRWADDFKRMREDMEFVYGFQWDGQKSLRDDRYVNNVVIRLINQKVAQLYAKNPQVDAIKRERLNYKIWDGDLQSIQEAVMMAQQALVSGQLVPLEVTALLSDFQQGTQMEQLTDRVCNTLRLAYQYQVDVHRPDFKEEMKRMVRRAIVCGVGYVRVNFVRENTDEGGMSSVTPPNSVLDRLKAATEIKERLDAGELELTDPEIADAQSLIRSAGVSAQDEDNQMQERLEFDWPAATSIIPDRCCRSLKEFVAARRVTHEYVLPVDLVNQFYNCNITVGGSQEAKEYAGNGQEGVEGVATPTKRVCVWEVFDYVKKMHCVVVDGWQDYVVEWEPVTDCSGFWPIFALTFNDIEYEEGTKSSIYPPSDVRLVVHPQKEWNRARQGLRDQRNANAPKYPVRKGMLTEGDKQKLIDAVPNSVIELEGIPPEIPPDQFVKPMQMAAIDMSMYATQPLESDIMYASGMQEASMGAPEPRVTATVGVIAEQARMTVSSSNVDDLDGLLSRVAKYGGEQILRNFSVQTVMEIVGPGCAFPQTNRVMFLKQLLLTIVASSSGKPNKAVDSANFERLAPILMSAGANPLAVIEEAVKRLDDRLDVKKFFPMAPPIAPTPPGGVDQSMGDNAEQPTKAGDQNNNVVPMPTGQAESGQY